MPRPTLLLIITLAVVTSILLFLAIKSQPTQAPTRTQPASPTPAPAAQTKLMILPNPAIISPNASESIVNITIDTGENRVKGIQFQLSYDPSVITNVRVKPGDFFAASEILQNDVSQTKGRVKYAIGGSLVTPGKKGKGIAAVVSFNAFGQPGQSAKIDFVPKSIVAAENVSQTAISAEVGTTIQFSQQTSSTITPRKAVSPSSTVSR